MRTSARSYAASGIKRGERIVSTYNAGPFVAGAALGAFDRLGLCHIPVGSGNTERLMAAVDLLKPTAVAMTPSYALHLVEWGQARHGSRESSVKRVMVAGEPGGGEPAMRAKLEAGWGASVTEAMGIGDISVTLWGECEEKAGMHFSGRGFVHIELIDPETGRREADRRRRRGRTRADPSRQPLGAASALSHPRSRADERRPVRLRPHEPTRPLHRPHRRHADRARGQRLSLRRARGGQRIRPRGLGRHHDPSARARACGRSRRCRSASSSRRARRSRGSPSASARGLRDKLLVTTEIELAPAGALPRSEYKSKLVEKA